MKYKNYSTAMKHIDKVNSLEDINFESYTLREKKDIFNELVANDKRYAINEALNRTSEIYGVSMEELTVWNSPLNRATLTDFWSLQRQEFWSEFYKLTDSDDASVRAIYDRNSYLSNLSCEFFYTENKPLNNCQAFADNMSSLDGENLGKIIPICLHKNDRDNLEKLYNHIKNNDLSEYENQYLDYMASRNEDKNYNFLKDRESIIKFIELSVENGKKFEENFKQSPLFKDFEKEFFENDTVRNYGDVLHTFFNTNHFNYNGVVLHFDTDTIKQMIDNIRENRYSRNSLEVIKSYIELSKDNKEELQKDISEYMKDLIRYEDAHLLNSDNFNDYAISENFVSFFDLKDTIKEMLIEKPYAFSDKEMKLLVNNEMTYRHQNPFSASDFTKEEFIKAHNNLLECENYGNTDGYNHYDRNSKAYTDIFFSDLLKEHSELCADDNFIKNVIANMREYSGDNASTNNYAYNTLKNIAKINSYTNPNKLVDFTFSDKFIGEFLEKQKEISDEVMANHNVKITIPPLNDFFSKDAINENMDKILSIYSLESIVYSKFLTTEDKVNAFKFNKDCIELEMVDRLRNDIYRVKDKELEKILQKKQDEDYSNLDRETYRKNVKNGDYEVTDDKLKAYASSDFKHLYDEYIANTTNVSNEFIKNHLLSMVDENVYCNLVLNAYKNTIRPKEKVNESVKENKETDTLDVIDIPTDKTNKIKDNQYRKG